MDGVSVCGICCVDISVDGCVYERVWMCVYMCDLEYAIWVNVCVSVCDVEYVIWVDVCVYVCVCECIYFLISSKGRRWFTAIVCPKMCGSKVHTPCC